MGMRHLRVLRDAGVAVAAVPKRRDRAVELAEEGFEAFSDLDAAFAWGAGFAIVCSDTAAHAQDAIDCLDRGWPVLVEKPLAASVSDALRIAEALPESPRVWVACLLRCAQSLACFRDQLSRIGRVHAVHVSCQSFLPEWRPQRPYRETYSARASEGGVLRDLVHDIDYAAWIFGWPERLQARVRNFSRLGIEAEESADLWWECREGPVVSLHLDYLARPPRREIQAFGEYGTLRWDGIGHEVVLLAADGTCQVYACAESRDAILLAQDTAFLAGDPHQILARYMEGLAALKICEAAKEASCQRREIAIG
jgi:predicted dehydrogenase